VNDLDQFGSTPLILAAQRDWAQVVKELLQRDVDPNHQNLFGSTALRPGGSAGWMTGSVGRLPSVVTIIPWRMCWLQAGGELKRCPTCSTFKYPL